MFRTSTHWEKLVAAIFGQARRLAQPLTRAGGDASASHDKFIERVDWCGVLIAGEKTESNTDRHLINRREPAW